IITDPVGSYLMATTARILDNEFEKATIKSINVDIALEDGHNTAKIERIYVDKPIVAPGDTVTVSCVMRPYNREPITRTMPLTIPRDIPDGNMLIGVSSGDDIDAVRKRMGLVDPPPENLDQVAKKIREAGSGDDLVAVIALPAQSILINGTVLPNPPAHWAKLFFSDRYTRGPSLIKGEVRKTLAQDILLDGSHIMTVEVRRPDKAATRSQPYMATASGSYSSADGIFMTDLARKTMESSSHKVASDSKEGSSSSQASAQASASSSDAKPGSAPAYWTSVKEYPHMRSLLVWAQETQGDFMQGKAETTTVDSWGRISPALQALAKKQMDKEMRIWSS
ncbi:MAG: hypothetical protein ACRD3W_09570, partial [Terriglobales bacterium]